MSRKINIRDWITWLLVAAAVLLLAGALTISHAPHSAEIAAGRMSREVEKRMAIVEGYIADALAHDPDSWLDFGDIPSDIVIYRYVDDTLKSWSNQFTVMNDDIGSKVVFERLSNVRNNISSPLATVGEETAFFNFGPKWYLARSAVSERTRIIAGLEILNTSAESQVNGRLKLNEKFSVEPLSYPGGETVTLHGQPVFKIIFEQFSGRMSFSNSILVWLALLCYVIASVVFLSNRPTLRNLLIVMLSLLAVMTALSVWGRAIQGSAKMFSPSLYADGWFMNSLGSAVTACLSIFLAVLYSFIARGEILRSVLKKNKMARARIYAILLSLSIFGIIIFAIILFQSIIMNSSITLELYKLNDLSPYTAVVYLSLVTLILSIPFLLHLLFIALEILHGVRLNVFSRRARVAFALLVATGFVAISAVTGSRREQNTVDIWANRLSMDRDISLEIQLRQVEGSIAADRLIASLSVLDNGIGMIVNRVIESYLFRISRDYDVAISVMTENNKSQEVAAYFNDKVRQGVVIAPGSNFLYTKTLGGLASYTGVFSYYHPSYGMTRMLVEVEPKSNREDMGYASILGYSAPGQVVMPARYTYAKYVSGKLVTFKGNYAYPTVMTQRIHEDVFEKKARSTKVGNYVHFLRLISDDEVILISRPPIEAFSVIVAGLSTTLVFYILVTLLSLSRRDRRKRPERSYFKTRITGILLGSLILTLVALAAVSVIFVYRRNNANMQNLITDKVNSIQTIVSGRVRYVQDWREMGSAELTSLMDDVSNIMRTDITLYSPAGQAFISTTPEIFERMVLGGRLNHNAYRNIVHDSRRFYIHKENIAGHKYYFMYAPVMNSGGEMVAIMGSPYTDQNYDFKSEAVMHSISIVTIFLILLILSWFATTAMVRRMFRPITEMSRKMNEADLDNLEYIIYDRDDEISPLARAYNLMVHDLSESTRKLTMSERDKAWATMARQVAHEIKNPLTPIKLQIQRLIRLKQNNNPLWEEKFEEISKEILSQIDILSDTATEFSTFAKLYTEEPVTFNLGKLIREEVDLFDTSDSISLSYIGLEDAVVDGPKPQLTRVLVNLISNAIQSVEEAQDEQRKNGEEPAMGEVVVSLRNSGRDGYYDIVVEDNGPGVSDENRGKLFTPNFTTKSKGTGLGLAICRNIIEKCNGEIFYSKSFGLQGACFTVRYPKPGTK